MQKTTIPQIHKLLSHDRVFVGLVAETKDAVINQLVGLLEGHPAIKDLEAIREAVLRREKVMSTGVGKGLGLPHAKTSAVDETLAALAILKDPVSFGAIDNQPVKMVFLLIGTEESKSQHIKILSRISRLMNRDEFRKQLLLAPDVQAVMELIEKSEAALLDA